MSWQNEKQLKEVLGMLHASLRGDNEQQMKVYKKLQQLRGNQEFNQYLAFIISSMKKEPEQIRQQAGLLLKNNIHESYERMDPKVRNYIKLKVLQTIGDESKKIRKTIGHIVTTAASKDKLKGWQPVLKELLKMLESNKYEHVDGAFNALCKICEDEPERLDSQDLGRPLNTMLPLFIKFFVHPKEPIRRYALGAVNQFLGPNMPQALRANMTGYLKGLFVLTKDSSVQIRKRICQAFVLLLDNEVNALLPHLKKVMEFMITSTGDKNEEVALEACEFWTSVCEQQVHNNLDPAILNSYLRVLVPILLKGMVYSPLDLIGRMGADEDDSHVPDREQDIAPRHHSAKVSSYNGSGGDDWDDDDEDASDWNLRKCAAAALDTLATVYKDELLPFLLPMLQKSLDKKTEWQIQEAGILALGAIADGCFSGVSKHLHHLIPYLIGQLKHPKPLIRSITCWTLSRYAKWVVKGKDDDEKYFKPLMVQLLQRVLDKNKAVQEAACSAFAILEEQARGRLVPYLEPILKNLTFALQKYQAKNMLLLYDAIGSLAEAAGSALNRKELIKILMPPLIQRWNKLDDRDRNLFPIGECLSAIAVAVRSGFLPFAQPIFNRCLQIIHNTLVEQNRVRKMGENARLSYDHAASSEKEFIVVSLDLLAGIADGLGSSVASLVGNSKCLMLLFECLKDPDGDVRQSAFALLGDLARACIGHLKPHFDKFIPISAANIDPHKSSSVCNNASWALGEMAFHAGGNDMAKYIPGLMQRLVPILNGAVKDYNNPSLMENAAITMGRLGLVSPEIVAPHLHHFSKAWCNNLCRILDPKEREHAFRGLCSCIHKNPKGIVNAVPELIIAIASCSQPSEGMANMFHTILKGLHQMMGAKLGNGCNQKAFQFVMERYRVAVR
mmetsp:Transcript_25495/g.42708  ORF Transcript_25495/g.42708 Transcript_25495/m.42708 type:complete len:899 (-) Transcript_25495:814-3510(-)